MICCFGWCVGEVIPAVVCVCMRVCVRACVCARARGMVTDITAELGGGWNGVCSRLRGMILAVKLWDCVPHADGWRVK